MKREQLSPSASASDSVPLIILNHGQSKPTINYTTTEKYLSKYEICPVKY